MGQSEVGFGAFCKAKAGCPFQARLFGLVVADWPEATLQTTLADAQQGQLSLLGPGRALRSQPRPTPGSTPLGRWAYPGDQPTGAGLMAL